MDTYIKLFRKSVSDNDVMWHFTSLLPYLCDDSSFLDIKIVRSPRCLPPQQGIKHTNIKTSGSVLYLLIIGASIAVITYLLV